MSTSDQLLYSDLHGTAWRHAAEQHNLAEAIAELRETAGGRSDVLAQAAGVTAGLGTPRQPPMSALSCW